MFVVRLSGGLGNQMFQYAFGQALSLSHSQPVYYDLSFYRQKQENTTPRTYELDIFEASVSEIEIDSYERAPFPSSLIKRWYLFFTSMRRDKYLIQIDEYHYKPILSSSFLRKYKWYFNGYWQNENYFKTYSQKILHDFTPKDNLFSSTLEKDAADIQQCNAISIHFRRGDYVSNTKTAQHHGVCSIEYYMNAVQYVAKRVESPYFYIFSDDIDWVKSNFSLRYGNRVIEGNNQYNSFTDMYLMSLCKHHIIANSTFSWWGAWLGRNPDKIVITPQRWFADFSRNEEKKSIVPPDWIRL